MMDARIICAKTRFALLSGMTTRNMATAPIQFLLEPASHLTSLLSHDRLMSEMA
jgi:hypothetical protein